MRWQEGRRSDRVEDRRGMRAGPTLGVGAVVLALVAVFLGADPKTVMQFLTAGTGQTPGSTAGQESFSAEENELADFVSVVLADTEDTWTGLFREAGSEYRPPNLVLFSGAVQSACGHAQAAVGPFYCPGDEKVYIDLSFYSELKTRYKAPGDFAQAYVIAHEIGHHIQNLLGTSEKVQAMRSRLSEAEYNQMSVRLELQADFLAGVWAHHADKSRNIIETGDIEEALTAASSIGDDKLQREATGTIRPDAFTHGTSEQRMRWFRRGLETGDISKGDTFNARVL